MSKWQLLKEVPYKLNFVRMVKRTYKLPNGEESDFDITINRPVAVTIPLTDHGTVVMAKQYRPGPNQTLLELPAGIVDDGETPLEAAKRELLEETGYTGEFQYIGPQFRDAYSTIVLHVYVVHNAHKIVEHSPEGDEFIEVEEITVAEFIDHIKTGNLTDVGPAYTALHAIGLITNHLP